MKNQIVVNNSIVLDNVELVQGKETKCYHAVLVVDGLKLKVTYDLNSSNLVIADWFKLDQGKLPMIMELVKAIFREEKEKTEMRELIEKFVAENEGKKLDFTILGDGAFSYIEMNQAVVSIEADEDEFCIMSTGGDGLASSLYIRFDSVTSWTDDCKEFGDYYIESITESIF